MRYLIFLITLIFSWGSFASVTIGLVDVQKVLLNIKEGKAVNKTLEKSYKAKQKTLKKEEDAIRKEQESLQKQLSVLSDKAIAKKEQELQQKIIALQGKTAKYQKEIQKQESELKKPILDKLRPIITSVSEKAKVDVTFELNSAPIIYAKTKKDITDDVVKAYDKKHSGK